MISAMSENQMSTEFDFSDDAGKKEAHWGRDKNVRDVLIHLYEWHQLLIDRIIRGNACISFCRDRSVNIFDISGSCVNFIINIIL